MTNIIPFNQKNAAIDPNVVLSGAVDQYESVFVIGWDKDGQLDARASLNLDHAAINWLISVFQKKLLNGDYSS